MRNLFSGMKQTEAAVAPFALLNELRALAPQFAEMDERGGGFAQQGEAQGNFSLRVNER
jgi:hypothetical protein